MAAFRIDSIGTESRLTTDQRAKCSCVAAAAVTTVCSLEIVLAFTDHDLTSAPRSQKPPFTLMPPPARTGTARFMMPHPRHRLHGHCCRLFTAVLGTFSSRTSGPAPASAVYRCVRTCVALAPDGRHLGALACPMRLCVLQCQHTGEHQIIACCVLPFAVSAELPCCTASAPHTQRNCLETGTAR